MPPAAAYIDPCNGQFPHRQAAGCCPLQITIANRVVVAGANTRTATAAGVLPSVLQDSFATADISFLNIVDHSRDHTFDLAGATPGELMTAVRSGVVQAGDAMGDLAGRIAGETPDNQRTINNIMSAMESLVKIGHIATATADCQGNMLRLWAIACKKTKLLGRPIIVLEGDQLAAELVAEGKKSRLSVERLTTEQLFDSCIYQWTLYAHVLGVMPMELSAMFVFEAVYVLRLRHGESFWVAQEYLIACLDNLDRQRCKVADVANFDRGVMLADATRFADHFSSAFGEASGAVPLANAGTGNKPPWNNQCQPGNSRANCCPYYNRNKAHDNPKHLDSTGKCIFRHLCNHWVTDKGPSGRCLATDHGWHNCSNASKCDTPLA
jgi:hypothetical protein